MTTPEASPRRRRAATKTKTKKKTDPFFEIIELLVEAVAGRVVAKLSEKHDEPEEPRMVPVWVLGQKPPRGTRLVDEETPEEMLHGMGLLTIGDPGYEEALARHLARKEAHDAEMAARARMRTAARLLRKLAQGHQ